MSTPWKRAVRRTKGSRRLEGNNKLVSRKVGSRDPTKLPDNLSVSLLRALVDVI
jgi:hypothetical protein